MNITFSDRQKQTMLVALEQLRQIKQAQLSLGGHKQLNEHDILSNEHTLMHTITLLATLTRKPITAYTQNPSQLKPNEQNKEQDPIGS